MIRYFSLIVCFFLIFLMIQACQAEYLPYSPPSWSVYITPGYDSTAWSDIYGNPVDLSGGQVYNMTPWSSYLNPEFNAVVEPGTWIVFGPGFFQDEDFCTDTGQLVSEPYPDSSAFLTFNLSSPDSTVNQMRGGDPRWYATLWGWQAPEEPGIYQLDMQWLLDSNSQYFPENIIATGEIMVTPEPGSLLLLGSGVSPLIWLVWKRRKR